jgi:hypothetical protein
MLRNIGVILLASFAGLVGGVIGGALPRATIKARDFVLVDATGAPRATLAILPDPSCRSCDGSARLIVFDPRNPQQSPMMWPQSRTPISPAMIDEIVHLAPLILH